MALKKHISYQWRLFIPLVAILWLMVLALGLWMHHSEKQWKIAQIREQVSLINSRIISAYEDDIDPGAFLRFIGRYYRQHPLYDQVRISTYYKGKLIYSVGDTVRLTNDEQLKAVGITQLDGEQERVDRLRSQNNFYYSARSSNDGNLISYTTLPFDSDVQLATSNNGNMYLIMIVIACVATLLAFLMSRRLGRNISMLRDFALRAGSDPDFVPSMDFSHDELGDISRQIVRFYNERNRSILKLKREHNVAMHSLEEKALLKRQLTNNINHELKTPIGVIKGYLDTINEHPEMDEESRNHFLKKVGEHVNRLTALMNDLSTITRLEEGSSMINSEVLDYHEVVFTAANDFEESGILKNMEFNYDVPTYCRVIGNFNLLQAMITNLTKNAVAYSKGTECNLILTGEDDDFYHFAFYDNGVGVKPQSLDHLFERFFREDTGRSRKSGGTGLGLPIVENTILSLGGSISVANRDGGGLIFRYTLRKAKNSSKKL